MTDINSNVWVSASQIAQAEYCPYQLYLQSQGESLSDEARDRMDRGNLDHLKFGKAANEPQSRVSRWLLLAFLTMLLIALIALNF